MVAFHTFCCLHGSTSCYTRVTGYAYTAARSFSPHSSPSHYIWTGFLARFTVSGLVMDTKHVHMQTPLVPAIFMFTLDVHTQDHASGLHVLTGCRLIFLFHIWVYLGLYTCLCYHFLTIYSSLLSFRWTFSPPPWMNCWTRHFFTWTFAPVHTPRIFYIPGHDCCTTTQFRSCHLPFLPLRWTSAGLWTHLSCSRSGRWFSSPHGPLYTILVGRHVAFTTRVA